MQDINLNQFKLKLNDSYRKDATTGTKFEPSNEEDVVSKSYLDTNLSEMNGHISYFEKKTIL